MCTSVKPPKGFFERPDPRCIKCDYIGPPDKDSNIRPFVRCIRSNESNVERKLRMKLLDVEEWNHSFWSRHNKRFYDVSKKTICRTRFVIRLIVYVRACFCKSKAFGHFVYGKQAYESFRSTQKQGVNFSASLISRV